MYGRHSNTRNSKIFCKMCFDAGKSEKQYTSHTIRNKDGIVVCPYLLTIECRYCHEKGHTPVACPLLLSKNLSVMYDVTGLQPMPKHIKPLVFPSKHTTKHTTKQKRKKEPKKQSNTFDALSYSSDEEETKQEETVTIVASTKLASAIVASVQKSRHNRPKISWADICDSDDDNELYFDSDIDSDIE